MKNTDGRFFAILLVTAILIGAMPIIKAAPPPAPAFWIEPETLNFDTAHANVGDKFNVTLFVSTTGDTFTYQYEVDFNATQLACVSARYSAGATSQLFAGHAIIPVATIIDNTTGKILGGESLQGADVVHATAAAMIINMTFQIAASPPINGNLTSLISLNPENTYLLDSELNTVPNVALGHATYTFSGGAPPPTRHDVAITSVTPSNDHPKQNDTISIAVAAMNNGTVTETFDVNVTYDGTLIEKQTVTSLAAGSTTNLTFDWNTTDVAVGQYTITATAVPVTGETDLSNNAKTSTVRVLSAAGPITDVNGDGKVNMQDIGIVAKAFDTTPGMPLWDLRADVNGDGIVNLVDIALIAKDFWKH